MNLIKYTTIIIFLFLNLSVDAAQKDSTFTTHKPGRKVTIEPAIGLNPWPISDLVISNLIQFNLNKRFSLVSHSAYYYNCVFLRDFNHIKTNYSYALAQRIGVGTTLYSKRSSYTFSFMAGVKYNTFKETLENPEFEKVSASVTSTSPDFGLLYNVKRGMKKYFFSYRMYIPLYPYPFKSTDTFSIDGNMANVSMEFGVGIRLK